MGENSKIEWCLHTFNAWEGCEKVSAGLKGFDNPEWQEKLAATCAEKASKGLSVCRLKSGDPFIFGNGAETVEYLKNLGCDIEVVPGISSGISAAISRGIPLTHTTIPAALCLASGHHSLHSDPPVWKSMAGCGTIIIYMGVGRIPHIANELMLGGMSGDTHACFIERATQPSERLVSGTLSTIAAISKKAGVKEPAVCIIGRMAGDFNAVNFNHTSDPGLGQNPSPHP